MIFESLWYPPTESQLTIVGFFGNIWIVRGLSLLLLLGSIYFWFKLVKKIVNYWVSLISCLVILFSPTFYVLWLAYPVDCLKFFLLILLLYLTTPAKGLKKWSIFISVLFLVAFSFVSTKERSSFVHKIGVKDAKLEVEERFRVEDSLKDPIIVPLKIKRIVYNKYFLAYKEIINEIIPYFDIDTWFFQEIHPLEQKSVVLFVWPEIFLFIAGIYFLIKVKNPKLNLLVILMFVLSFVDFLFSPLVIFRKFELVLWPIALIIAMAVVEIVKTKIVFSKIVGITILFLSVYGLSANYNDLNKRPDYWLDNRPYFYDFVFKAIKEKGINNFSKIYVTSLVGNSENYCKYYFSECDLDKFMFNSFDLEKNKPEKNSIYAGFVGEFVGSDFKNNIKSDWKTSIKDKGFSEIRINKIRDTIAYKFGNEVVVGEIR